MLETIGDFLSNVAVYIAALLGLGALYFLWVTLREWRASQRAAFGVERDMATSEMIGAIGRVGVLVFLGLIVLGLGQLGEKAEPSEETSAQSSQPSVPTISVLETATPGSGELVPTPITTPTPQPADTVVAPLPSEPTLPAAAEPTPQTARVIVFGGVWLRDAPNGGTIAVLPQDSVVELLEGREFAGNFEWQHAKVLSTPPGSEALVDREGWVAFTPEFLEVNR